jgi:hypothetical protein
MKQPITSLLAFFVFLAGSPLSAANKDTTGADILRWMHKAFYQGPCRIYTFSQKNTHYRNDSVTGNSVWHEAIEFPDKFRINFGDAANGNFVVFRNDSAFNYKAGKKVKQRADQNTLLLLLGGMYYRDLEDVLARLKAKGYKLDIYSEQTWMDAPVYVIGAQKNQLMDNQVWVDKKTLRVVRIIEKMNELEVMDMRFESHQKWCTGFVETKVSFRRNGKLEQVEEYYDIKEVKSFPAE